MSFAGLPYELRSHIWSLVSEPRRITEAHRVKSKRKFKMKHRRKGLDILYETTSTPPPAVVQVCREARRHAPYKKCFTAGTEARWTWVNFEVDIFCITETGGLEDIVSPRSDIQRLQIGTIDEPDWEESVVRFGGLKELVDFTNLREIKIMLEAGDRNWCWYVQDGFHSQPEEIFTFVDQRTGLAMTGPQLRFVQSWMMVMEFHDYPPDPNRLSEEIAIAHQPPWSGCMSMAQIYELD